MEQLNECQIEIKKLRESTGMKKGKYRKLTGLEEVLWRTITGVFITSRLILLKRLTDS